METTKTKLYLVATIFLLIVINLLTIIKTDRFLRNKPFTYEDGIVLYNICQKNGGSKELLINRIYEDNNTDFREFLLGK